MAPRVSIGLPVYNGERFITEALDSVMAQTFEDFELLISDNASTDATGSIAASFAERDQRVRHLRHAETKGATWNFNTVFGEATGDLFVWLAHDDAWEPDFLERCVEAFDRDAGVVLAFSNTSYVDEDTEPAGSREYPMRTNSERVSERLWDVLMVWHDCLPVFGVIRRSALAETGLIGPYAFGDHLLLAELCLLGRFEIFDDHLFRSRLHPGQSIQQFNVWVDHHAYGNWFTESTSGRPPLPMWQMLGDLLRAVWRARPGLPETAGCLAAIGRWTIRYRRLLLKDLGILGRYWWRRPRARR